STNGAPPSGSPAQRKTGGASAAVTTVARPATSQATAVKPTVATVQAARCATRSSIAVDCSGRSRMRQVTWRLGLGAALTAAMVRLKAVSTYKPPSPAYVGSGFSRTSGAQPPANPNAPAAFTKISAPVFVLAHARVVDGTGAPARANQTLIIRDGAI